jgi:hypothetical protein
LSDYKVRVVGGWSTSMDIGIGIGIGHHVRRNTAWQKMKQSDSRWENLTESEQYQFPHPGGNGN